MDDSEIGKISYLIQAAIDAAYQRGRADAKRELREMLFDERAMTRPQMSIKSTDMSEGDGDTHLTERKRAPKGLPRALTDRVLAARTLGATAQDVADAGETDYEKMIAVTSIRGELRKGQAEGRYQEKNGLWFLRS